MKEFRFTFVILMFLMLPVTRMMAAETAPTAALSAAPANPGIPDLTLPAPRQDGGKPIMQALRERQTNRVFGPDPLPMQMLSDLLWAAAGVNRSDSGKRTFPSARNWQTIDVLVFLAEGTYRYDAKTHVLKALAKGDLRPLAGKQDFVASAPLNIVFVADTTRIPGDVSEEDRLLYFGSETGFISQNIYLFCASEGLSTVVRAMVDRPALSKALNLRADQRITLSQTVGFPGK